MIGLRAVEEAAMRFPRFWDMLVRAFPGVANREVFDLFDRFSREHDRRVNFVQIGASDGMRCDPVREFVVRDSWRGTFVEPLPEAFRMLRENYAYVAHEGLQFVNAAISDAGTPLEFWTFTERFLSGLSVGDRMAYLRKSSLDRDHVERHVGPEHRADEVIEKVSVSVMTLGDLVRKYSPTQPVDLLVIDAEGHEARILAGADLEAIRPGLIFFESHNLRDESDRLEERLRRAGYRLQRFGGDTAATLA